MDTLTCFKSYDIRGQLGSELNEDIAYRIGRAYAQVFSPKNIVVGGDIRLTSESLKCSLSDGLRDAGVNVTDIGMVGTEQVYFATSFLSFCGGIEVTASHNPINYNGMKLVGKNSKPISSDTGLLEIKYLAQKNKFEKVTRNKGSYRKLDLLEEYLEHILGYVDSNKLGPLKIVMNSGNGAAGPVICSLEQYFNDNNIPIKCIKLYNKPDGAFPNGIPNPILKENRQTTIDKVKTSKADFGIAWDGDFDRCFFIDENGRFIEGYYIVGLLTKAFLQKHPGAKIVHDPRLTWNTIEIAKTYKGIPIQSKTGHAFIKEKMRLVDAIYGGEMSAHHYFKEFFYCDSGMIPWLLVAELLCKTGKPLSKLVDQMIEKYPSPGEINFKVQNPEYSISMVKKNFESSAINIDHTDGISMEFEAWRFNLRASNTEPLVRLNIESRSDKATVDKYVDKISSLLKGSK